MSERYSEKGSDHPDNPSSSAVDHHSNNVIAPDKVDDDIAPDNSNQVYDK